MNLSIKDIFSNPRISYIVLNISLSGLAFIRSFISLKYLSFYELGLVGIVQILMMVMSMLQIGMVTGGYKMYSIQADAPSVNNTITSYLGVVILLAVPVILFSVNFKDGREAIVLFGILVGGLALYNNWLTCMMLAKDDVKSLNMINLLSAIASLLTLPTILFWNVYGVLLGTAIGPIIFFVVAMFRVKYLRPSAFILTISMLKKILYYGFVPYLTSTFYYINVQIERWAIVKVMGVAELGKLSLCVVLSAAFMVVPTSISNLYFPHATKSYADGDFVRFRAIMKKYAFILLIYGSSFLIVSALTIGTFVPIFFPKHAPQIHLIYLMLPALLFTGLNTTFTIIFNAAFKYWSIITVNLAGLAGMIACISIILRLPEIKLNYFVIAESAVAILIFISGAISFLFIKSKLYIKIPGPDEASF